MEKEERNGIPDAAGFREREAAGQEAALPRDPDPGIGKERPGAKVPQKVRNYLVYSIGVLLALGVFYLLFGRGGEERTVSGPELPDPSADSRRLLGKQDQYAQDQYFGGFSSGGDDLDLLFSEAVSGERKAAEADPYEEVSAALGRTEKTMEGFEVSVARQREEPPGLPVPDAGSGREAVLEAEADMLRRRLREQDETMRGLEALLYGDGVAEEAEGPEPARASVRVEPLPDAGLDGGASRLSAGFHGFGAASSARRNTIRASVYGRQVVASGQQVRMRLEEPMLVGGQVMHAGSLLTGVAAVGPDRLYVTVTELLQDQVLVFVDMEVYDLDGRRGLSVPGSLENEALRDLGREVAGSMASTTEQTVTSLVNTTKASEQLKTDLARGALQGASRFIGKKLEEVKITVRDGHKVLLYPNN